MGEVCLNFDGASQNKLAACGELMRTHIGRHNSNFYSYYGSGTNNLGETRALLDIIFHYKILGITTFQVHSD